MIISEQKILKEYCFIYGFDFNDKRQIEAVKNSLGFQRYVLCIKVEKFKELLWEEIKNIKLLNWIIKVCKLWNGARNIYWRLLCKRTYYKNNSRKNKRY